MVTIEWTTINIKWDINHIPINPLGDYCTCGLRVEGLFHIIKQKHETCVGLHSFDNDNFEYMTCRL